VKKKLLRSGCFVIAVSMLVILAAACGDNENQTTTDTASDDRTWEFTIAMTHAEIVSPNWHRVFGSELYEQSGGRINSTFYWAGSLLTIPEVPRGLQVGTATIANMPSPNYVDILPLNTRILQLPFIGLRDAITTAEIYMQLLNEFPEMREEMAQMGIIPLGATPLGRYDLKLIDTNPVRVPSDLAGRQIVPYKLEFLPLLETYNAAGSFIPPGQIFEALERGVVDGYIATWAFAGFFGLTDLIHQHIDFGQWGAFQEVNIFAMSLATWNELPEYLQNTIMDVLWYDGGFRDIYYGDTAVLAQAQRDIATEKGDLIITLTQEEMDVWASYILPLHQQTIDEINDLRGDDVAQRIYNRILEILGERFG